MVTVDRFQPAIDERRCTSVAQGRRCQLWDRHHRRGIDEHAAEWTEPKSLSSYRRGSGQVARRHWVRWTDAGEVREQPPGSERLPWACMGWA